MRRERDASRGQTDGGHKPRNAGDLEKLEKSKEQLFSGASKENMEHVEILF